MMISPSRGQRLLSAVRGRDVVVEKCCCCELVLACCLWFVVSYATERDDALIAI